MPTTICSGLGEYLGMSLPLARFYQNLKIYLIDDQGLPFPPDNLNYKEYFVRVGSSGGANDCTRYSYRIYLKRIDDTLEDLGVFFYSITGNPASENPCSMSSSPIEQCNTCVGLPADAKNSSVELSCVIYPDSFAQAFNENVIDSIGTNEGLFIRGVGGLIETGFLSGSTFNYEGDQIFDPDIETFDIACVFNVLENVIDSGFIDVEMVDCLTQLNEIICCTEFPTKCQLLFFDEYTLNVPPIGSITRVFFRLGFYFPHVFLPHLGGLPLDSYCYYKSFLFEDHDVVIQSRATNYQQLITDWVNNFNEIQDEKMRLLFKVKGYTMQNQGQQVNPLGSLEGAFILTDTQGNQLNFLFNNTGYSDIDNEIF